MPCDPLSALLLGGIALTTLLGVGSSYDGEENSANLTDYPDDDTLSPSESDWPEGYP